MAAVAGAIAWAGVEAMMDAGAVFGVIDNGGDIALVSDRSIRVGVHAGGAGTYLTGSRLLSLRRKKYWVSVPHQQQSDPQSPLALPMQSPYSPTMSRLPTHGQLQFVTRSGRMIRLFSIR